jgi:parallel beta-helix repeat protein
MERTLLRSLAACACAALIGAAHGARAVDGAIEINHDSIVAAGGYPLTIAATGGYVLTGNLTPPASTGALIVTAPDVTLDLNGFSIIGSGPIGTGISTIGASTLTVRNGVVTGFGNSAVNIGSGGKILQLKVSNTGPNGTAINGADGCVVADSVISGNLVGVAVSRCRLENNTITNNSWRGVTAEDSVIVHNTIWANGGEGISGGAGCTIQENVISDNGQGGIIDLGFSPVPPPAFPPNLRVNIRGNTITGNGGVGIQFQHPALISDNTVSSNASTGILCGAACTLQGNVIETNNTSGALGGGGASVADGSNVVGNTISFNTGFGLTLPATAAYSQNSLHGNSGPDMLLSPLPGPHPSSGFMNLCSGAPGPAPTCP